MKIDDLKKGLKETSFSKSHQEYMTYSKMKVIDFDEFKNQYVSENKIKSEAIKSNDALYFGRDKDYFIEFKNGKITNEIVFDIRKKIYDSILIFCDYYSTAQIVYNQYIGDSGHVFIRVHTDDGWLYIEPQNTNNYYARNAWYKDIYPTVKEYNKVVPLEWIQ